MKINGTQDEVDGIGEKGESNEGFKFQAFAWTGPIPAKLC
jgi:hypothetical protein